MPVVHEMVKPSGSEPQDGVYDTLVIVTGLVAVRPELRISKSPSDDARSG